MQKNRHLRSIAQFWRAMSSQLRHVLTIAKKLVKQQCLLQMSYNMVNVGLLTAKIGWWWAPLQLSTSFRVLASLLVLHRRRSTEVNHTLHDVWPSPGLVHYIYILGALVP